MFSILPTFVDQIDVGTFLALSSTNRDSQLPRKGDTYRDNFARLCLFLSRGPKASYSEGDYVIVATDAGNIEAIEAFASSCETSKYPPSALHFSQATSSAAATTINILNKVKGGNLTVNAGPHGLSYGLLAAAFYLDENPAGRCHLFFDGGQSDPESFRVLYAVLERDERASLEISMMPMNETDGREPAINNVVGVASENPESTFLKGALRLARGQSVSYYSRGARMAIAMSFRAPTVRETQ